LTASAVLRDYLVRNALTPVITVTGLQMAALLGGSILIETIFAVPGIGRHFVDAALNRDYPLVMGITLLYGAILILFNIATDVVRATLDPRIRNER
jgi:peptide/nickel transport system permease protein